MNISPIKFFQNNINCQTKDCKKPNAQNVTNNIELPGYNVAFGALIKDYDKNPLVNLKKEDRQEVIFNVDSLLEAARVHDEVKVKYVMDDLFKKYGNINQVHKYIITQGINVKDRQGKRIEPNYIYWKSYFDHLDAFFKHDATRKRKYLSMAIFTKNENLNNLVHASINKNTHMGNGIIPLVFDATKEFPTLQAKILESKNFQGRSIGDRILPILNNGNDAKKINEVLNELCTRTKAINRTASINLLELNKQILEQDNKEVLEALLSKECVCYGELSKENRQNSYTSLNSEDFRRLDNLSKEITVHGGTLTKDVVLTNTPPVEMKYMCLHDKESYMDVNKRDILRLCKFFNDCVDSDELEKFYTSADHKGRYISSSLCKSAEGLKLMNEACSKRGARVLYNIYMHKDKDGKTMADYMLMSDDELRQETIDELNDTLIDICASCLPVKELKALKDTYADFLDSRMQKIADEIDVRVKKAA